MCGTPDRRWLTRRWWRRNGFDIAILCGAIFALFLSFYAILTALDHLLNWRR